MSFANKLRLSKSTLIWVSVAAMVLATLLPALLNGGPVHAAQIGDRSITMATSQGATETSYEISFQVPAAVDVGGWRVQFCDEDPLPGETCVGSTSEGVTVPSLDADTGSAITVTNIVFDDTAGSTVGGDEADCVAPALATAHGASSNLTYFDVTCDAGDSATDFAETIVTGGGATDTDYISFTLNNVDNPSSIGSFYARIYTFTQDGAVGDTNTPIATYVATAAPLGNYEGGVAMSTADQITVEARVQERLDFTVGTDTVADDCSSISGTAVELGVLTGDATLNRATVDSAAATPNIDGICTEVTTNAASGANVSYIATDLAVSGASCTQANGDIDVTGLETDQCINWDNDSPAAYAAGNELWGLGILSTPSNGSTNVMQIVAGASDYDETAWSSTVTMDPYATLAIELGDTAGGVAEAEALFIDVAAEAAITTPTGLYEATLTFIATGSF